MLTASPNPTPAPARAWPGQGPLLEAHCLETKVVLELQPRGRVILHPQQQLASELILEELGNPPSPGSQKRPRTRLHRPEAWRPLWPLTQHSWSPGRGCGDAECCPRQAQHGPEEAPQAEREDPRPLGVTPGLQPWPGEPLL